MKSRMFFLLSLLMTVFALSWGIDQGLAQSPENNKEMKYRGGKVTTAERKAAAKRAQALGLKPGVAGKDTGTGIEPLNKRKKTGRPSTEAHR